MLVPFKDISDKARLWIYQADRKLKPEELDIIEKQLASFTSTWAAHGADLHTSYEIKHDQFVLLAVDEGFNQASGCSIDGSVHVMQVLAAQLKVGFFDRTKIAFLLDGDIYIESLSNLKTKVEQGFIKEDTLTFNNLVASKQELETSWVVQAKDTWMSKYFN